MRCDDPQPPDVKAPIQVRLRPSRERSRLQGHHQARSASVTGQGAADTPHEALQVPVLSTCHVGTQLHATAAGLPPATSGGVSGGQIKLNSSTSGHFLRWRNPMGERAASCNLHRRTCWLLALTSWPRAGSQEDEVCFHPCCEGLHAHHCQARRRRHARQARPLRQLRGSCGQTA